MRHHFSGYHYCILVFQFLVIFSAVAEIDSTHEEFLTELEATMRADYRLCTGDSSQPTLKELVTWHQSIESIISSPDYPVIVRKFSEETGISPADARPCEIVLWVREAERQAEETSRLLLTERKRLILEKKDSLYLTRELAGVKKALYDFAGIPFGLSKRSFLAMAKQNELAPVYEEGKIVRCDSAAIGIYTFKAAFHFNRHDRYWCYELESETCGADSIDLWARGLLEYMAGHIETSTQSEPDHIYRIGQFDIVPGRLAICKLWSFDRAAAYVGLSRSKNRYYAKTIVKSK
jgi:hypothetical protein